MKKNKKIIYPLTSSTWDEKEKNALKKLVKGSNFSMGENVKKFENNFAKFHKSKYSVMVNSGSSANLLMISSLFYLKKNKLQRGDEVVVPAVGWSTSYNPLYQLGLKIKFVDVDLETLNFDLKKLKKSISKKTRLILAINLLGNSNDFTKIKKIIKNKNIYIIEDNCESLGAKYKGKKSGTFGIMSSTSFFYSHHMSTIEGGAILTNNKDLYKKLKILRAHGWIRDIIDKKKLDFKNKFRFILPGYNLRPTEINGLIGNIQLKKLTSFVKMRRLNAKYFISKFKTIKNIIIQKEIGESSWFGFSIIIKNKAKIKREKIIKILELNGIETRPIVSGNFSNQEVCKFYNLSKNLSLNNSEIIDKNGFFIGNHHFDMKKKIIFVFNILKKYLD